MTSSPENSVSVLPANGHENYLRPSASITATPDGYQLTMDLPGVRKADLEVQLENGELTISGRRAHWPTDSTLVYRESVAGDFRRVFELDPVIDASRIVARLEDGVLNLTLPKGEQARARRIEITA